MCAKTVPKNEFGQAAEPKTAKIELPENCLYQGRQRPFNRRLSQDANNSLDGPDWFRIRESKIVKEHEIEKSQGYDGTVSVLSKASGWITVSPRSRSRKNRIGKNGPFDLSKKQNDLHKVSDLAPIWMQTNRERSKSNAFTNCIPPPGLRQDQKRVYLVERNMISPNTQNCFKSNEHLIEWNEDITNKKLDRPVTGKIGYIY